MTWPSPEQEEKEPAWNEHYASVPFAINYSIEDIGDGRVSFEPELNLGEFMKTLAGTEILRVRRCPACGKFYYAVRANKGACDEHLARERVRRGRDPHLQKKYEASRRINKLVKQKKLSIRDAKAVVEKKSNGRQKI